MLKKPGMRRPGGPAVGGRGTLGELCVANPSTPVRAGVPGAPATSRRRERGFRMGGSPSVSHPRMSHTDTLTKTHTSMHVHTHTRTRVN